MSKDLAEEKRAIVKRELHGHGLAIHLSTSREGANLIARVAVTDAATDKIVAKLVTVARVEDLDLVIGLDTAEGVARDFLAQLFGVAHALRDLVPAVTIEED
ncbi:MAG TPA: hypothetical protein VEY12_03955 [Thermoplasmata archaeon]|nr:hypothetical protein [Thermoplasmata archaeon]